MTVAVMLVLFFVFLAIGVPLAFCMGLSALIALAWEGQIPLLMQPQRFFAAMDNFSLLAVPLFILAGELMNVGGITERLVAFSRAVMGHLRGGLAQANVLCNMFMAAISGSAAADVAAIGSMMIPAMKREGYRADFAVAITACAALMAPIIPPSIVAVIYGSVAGLSVGALFLGGAIPGIIAGIGMMVMTRFLAGVAGAKPVAKATRGELGAATLRALPAMLMPLIIIGGIISGAFTPTEAGAVAAGYGLLFGFLTRRHTFDSLYRNFANAAQVTASVLIILAGAALFSWVLTRAGTAEVALRMLLTVSEDPRLLILIILAFLFVLGMFVEVVAALILIVPILGPIAAALGFDPIHFGIVTMMMLVVGAVTPPVGVLAMIACRIADIEYEKTFGMLLPYVAMWVVVIVTIAYVPALVTFLPSTLL